MNNATNKWCNIWSPQIHYSNQNQSLICNANNCFFFSFNVSNAKKHKNATWSLTKRNHTDFNYNIKSNFQIQQSIYAYKPKLARRKKEWNNPPPPEIKGGFFCKNERKNMQFHTRDWLYRDKNTLKGTRKTSWNKAYLRERKKKQFFSSYRDQRKCKIDTSAGAEKKKVHWGALSPNQGESWCRSDQITTQKIKPSLETGFPRIN